jgi:hypothetical protein
MVAVAQLVRAPVCGTGGCGFNSRQPPLGQGTKARVAASRSDAQEAAGIGP